MRQADGVRVLDDRSLNGVFVNGQRVEWHALQDGDEILVGRHALRFLDVPRPSAFGDAGHRGPPPSTDRHGLTGRRRGRLVRL